MPYKRLTIIFLLVMLSFSMNVVLGQEATEEVEITEEAPETTQVSVEETEEPSDADDLENGIYIVQVGDNLFRIALRFGMTTQELADANGITNPSLIFVGQIISIPGQGAEIIATPSPEPPPTETEVPVETEVPTEVEQPSTGSTYIVQVGDTLFRIAIRNNTTVSVLTQLNPQIANANLIFVGQSINLPDGSQSTSTDTNESDTTLDVELASGIEVFLGEDANVEELVSQTTQLGVQWIKITVDWSEIEPEQGTLLFDQLDVAVEGFDEAGFDVILTLTGAPEWSRPSATDLALQQPTYGPPDNLADFADFAGAVAEHYVGVVDAYEIWYQPNNRLSWMTPDVELRSDGYPDAHLSSVRYIDLLEVAYTAIKAADSDALVVTAGLAPTGVNDFYNSIDNFVFFEELLKQGALNFSDVIGIHVDGFSNAPDAECCAAVSNNGDQQFNTSSHFFFSDTLDNYRSILNRNGGSDSPLWVTRVAWGTADNALATPPFELRFVNDTSAEQQGEYIANAFETVNERGDIGLMIYYNLNACAMDESEACYYSAIDAEGSARPVFNALQDLDLTGESENEN